MIKFDRGAVLWIVPNEEPTIATAGGGVIGKSGILYGASGAAEGQSNSGTSAGWLGNLLGYSYSQSSGSVASVTSAVTDYATTYAALQGGNASGQGTAIQQVITKSPQGPAKQLPDFHGPATCWPLPIVSPGPPLVYATPTCGNISAIELITSQTPDSIFQQYLQTFKPVTHNQNSQMNFTGPGGAADIDVTGPGQVLTIALQGAPGILQGPFSVISERFDPAARTISAVTLQGHPLAGWRYWRVYSIGTNDVVVETGAYDQPGPGPKNFLGYYITPRFLLKSWEYYLLFIQKDLRAPQGNHLTTINRIARRGYPSSASWVKGYWDYFGDFTTYLLNNVCPSTSCN